MNTIHYWLNFIVHLNIHVSDWLNHYGAWSYGLLFFIIFCETGLVVTPFLPGDSLLFASGSLIANTTLSIHILTLILILAALCGDNVNYWFGRWLGPKIFTQDARWFKAKYLHETHSFYRKHGAGAIIIARFIPIVRTYVPFVAGIGSMDYIKFLIFSIIAAGLWVSLLLYLGYFFGGLLIVQQHFALVELLIIIISLSPTLISIIKRKFRA